MAPSSINTATMSVEEAADFVAIQAEIGSARRGLTKAAMSNPALGALIGGGLGGGTGLLASTFSADEEKRKRWLSNMLAGGLMGAGVGGAAGLGWDMSKNLRDGGDPVQKRVNEIRARINARRDAMAGQHQVTDHTGDFIRKYLPQLSEPVATPAELAELKALGQSTADLEGLNVAGGVSTVKEYAGRPGDVVLGGVVGTGLGHLYDRAARGTFDGKRVMGLTPEQIKGMPKSVGRAISEMQSEVTAARDLGGDMTPLTVRQKLMARLTGKAPAPSYQFPTDAPAPAPSRLQRLLGIRPKSPLRELFASPPTSLATQEQWNAMREPVMKTVPTGRKGKLVGGGLGMLFAPFISDMLEGMQQQQPASPFAIPPKIR